jgi:hypothetical protein
MIQFSTYTRVRGVLAFRKYVPYIRGAFWLSGKSYTAQLGSSTLINPKGVFGGRSFSCFYLGKIESASAVKKTLPGLPGTVLHRYNATPLSIVFIRSSYLFFFDS